MHLILTGATGLVGSGVLHAMISNPSISRISILSRRPVPQASANAEASAKCTVHLHPDFAQAPPPSVMSQLADARGVVWAQGISQTEVSKEQYEQITFEYPLTFARALAAASKDTATTTTTTQPVNFVYVSGEGATTTPGRFAQTFAVVKGRAEAALLELAKSPEAAGRLSVYSARPGGVDATHHPEIAEYAAGRVKGMKAVLYPPLLAVSRALYPSMISPTRELGQALVKLAAGDGRPLDGTMPGVSGEGRTVANVALRRLAGLK